MQFATTQWSVVLAAGRRGEEALAQLCAQYWSPVFAFVRRQGFQAEDAQDITQGFFTRLIEKGNLAAADQSRGRFRSFLLASCKNFIANEYDRANRLKRGGGAFMIPIDSASSEFAHDETPERVYDRQWCRTLLESALNDVRAGNERLFDRLRAFIVADDDAGSHAEAAADLGMTAGAVKVAVHRLRRRYREALRHRVADTVASPDDIEDEIRHLLSGL